MTQRSLSWMNDMLIVISSLSLHMCNCDCSSLYEHYFAFISAGSWLFLSPSYSRWFLWASLKSVIILYSKYAVLPPYFPFSTLFISSLGSTVHSTGTWRALWEISTVKYLYFFVCLIFCFSLSSWRTCVTNLRQLPSSGNDLLSLRTSFKITYKSLLET